MSPKAQYIEAAEGSVSVSTYKVAKRVSYTVTAWPPKAQEGPDPVVVEGGDEYSGGTTCPKDRRKVQLKNRPMFLQCFPSSPSRTSNH
ncbi:hypothetical protein ACMD2_06109 [Ananas comosus]|uniref:Uncharacterized protein n=1 Tax=Ananas comosus TaxID=4615 RepID=A0A199VQW7_ANACO|nr:hypothetical protein ACMD2_06109 [Ananas comosus]